MLHASALPERTIVTSDIAETRSFTMVANAKAFKTIIAGLYSDKIRAVIRELWSNAFDAHVAVGTPEVPFDCHLPTVFDPTFSVRDYGISLSHEDVMGLYTTIFASSKDESGTQVGKFGLGSKSPFAYVDTFTVTAWLGGEKRMYSAYVGKDGIPQIALMGREPSDEHHGLEVAFPVKTGDCDAFNNAATKVGLGFKTLPKMTGRRTSFVKLTAVMEDKGLWQLCTAAEGYFNAGTAYARQGCVVYPIDADAIPNITPEQASVLNSPFFIEFATRDLEITPSRESLSYEDSTCRNVLAAADLIIEEVRSRYMSQIAGCKTYWEACRAFTKLQTGSLDEALKKLLTEGLRWKGRVLEQQISMQTFLKHPSINHGNVQMTRYSPSSARRRRAMKWEPSSYITFSPLHDAVYFEDTTQQQKNSQGRIRWHFDNNRQGVDSLIWIKSDPKSAAFKRIFAAMGRPVMIDVTSLPKAPTNIRGYAKKPTKVKRLNTRRKFETADIDEDDDIVYVRLDRGETMSKDGNYLVQPESVYDLAILMVRYGLIDHTNIIGVPKSCKSAIKRNKHWRCLWDIAADAVAKNFDPAKAARAEHCEEVVQEGEFHIVKAFIEHNARPASTTSNMGKFIALFERVQERAKQAAAQRDWHRMARTINRSLPALPDYKVRWHPMATRVKDTYPMLDFASYVNGTNIWQVRQYVNLVDKCAECVQGQPTA